MFLFHSSKIEGRTPQLFIFYLYNIWPKKRYVALISLLCLHFFEKLQYYTFGKQLF